MWSATATTSSMVSPAARAPRPSASGRRTRTFTRKTPHGPRLAIRDGALDIGSLDTPGLGATEEPDYASMEAMPKAVWP
jgi:hypothetical protein